MSDNNIDEFIDLIDNAFAHTIKLGYTHPKYHEMEEMLKEHGIVGAMLHGTWTHRPLLPSGKRYENWAISFVSEEDASIFILKALDERFKGIYGRHCTPL